MQYRELGHTGLKVSRLCFGSLTIGPLQRGYKLHEGAKLIGEALELGVNFIDTAEIYNCYSYIREALRDISKEVIVASKSYAYTEKEMEESLCNCLESLNRDYIDIFLLHEQESVHTIKGHWPAVEYLVHAQEKGIVKAIGISTHYVAGVRAAASISEFDVIHPIINQAGIGIMDGNVQDMLEAIEFAAVMGKGIYGMKCLGGGHLISEADKAIDFVLSVPNISSVAVGMQSREEIAYNFSKFSGWKPDVKLGKKLKNRSRSLHVEKWCRGCGQCVERCSAGALVIVDGRVQVNEHQCTLCSYCVSGCPEFCIKVI